MDAESGIEIIVNHTYEKEEIIAKLAKTGLAELIWNVSDQLGRCDRIQPAHAAHKICSREMDIVKYNEDGAELRA